MKRAPVFAWIGLVVVYALTATRYLTHADSPEFVSLFVYGGFAHAPGSPTTVLLYRAFAWLPGDPRIASAYVTVLLGAAALAILYRAMRAWSLDRISSTLAMVFVGLHTQVWLAHTHPEAFATNNLFAAAILLFAAPAAPLRGLSRVAVLGLLAGLGLGGHQSLVLLAPVGLWGVWRGSKEHGGRALPLVVGGALLVASFWATYATMMLWDSPVSFGHIDDLDALVHHVLRKDYGTTSLGARGSLDPFGELAFWFVESLAASGVVGILLVFAGIMGVGERDAPSEGWRSLVATWVLAGPIFISILNITPAGPDGEVVKRFHTLPFFMAGPLIGMGIESLRRAGSSQKIPAIVGVGSLLLMLVGGGMRVHAIYDATLEDALRNVLRTLPEDAIYIGQGDHRYFGFRYLQQVEGLRPDVAVIEPSVLCFRWFIDDTRERLDLEIAYPETLADGSVRFDLRAALNQFLSTGRPVYVTNDFAPEVLSEFGRVPEGPGWRLLAPGSPPPSATELWSATEAAFEKFEHRAPPPEYDLNPWGWSLYNVHTRVLLDLVDRCDSEGAACAAPARALLAQYPDL